MRYYVELSSDIYRNGNVKDHLLMAKAFKIYPIDNSGYFIGEDCSYYEVNTWHDDTGYIVDLP